MKELRKLDKYLYKYRFKLLAGLLITIVSRVFSLVTPRLVGDSLTLIENYISDNSILSSNLKEMLLINIIINNNIVMILAILILLITLRLYVLFHSIHV